MILNIGYFNVSFSSANIALNINVRKHGKENRGTLLLKACTDIGVHLVDLFLVLISLVIYKPKDVNMLTTDEWAVLFSRTLLQ